MRLFFTFSRSSLIITAIADVIPPRALLRHLVLIHPGLSIPSSLRYMHIAFSPRKLHRPLPTYHQPFRALRVTALIQPILSTNSPHVSRALIHTASEYITAHVCEAGAHGASSRSARGWRRM
ncbi:hypothetical protein EI94DRAFT_1749297 [Lactarius quietus]|nr:hypothetical protein EI94DRAFT_1749297 [Lactarius quietus]